ncbi:MULTISPECIES: MFS transporter [unclassified Beijerinckia]|uniref:MFS transporter n=1 Tax=unclassified Beijerinckia TaxID=2638183 RepID=UPI000898D1A9|nr:MULTISPECIES: MFS transporter [unclassified Beijerinckia]MDH7799617.1 MFS family permease [Beijerinckia sp. GAS462]SEB47879.1 Predicted arabinose efflux permease, MFS family [Beijerinckia sp. 28-YEA-48]
MSSSATVLSMDADKPQTVSASERRRILAACFVGATIEWYDFFIYGAAAALVLAPQFFPNVSPLAGTLAALATFSVGFIARPLGGAVMGHFGDRIGRKPMLVLTLAIMGVSTLLIGLLPNYESIGIAAPILLVVLRLLQGFGVGGEWGAAVLMAVEHAPPRQRAVYGAFPQMGIPAGIILSVLAFLAVGSWLPSEAFQSWGWRIPFLLSAILIVVGFVVRMTISESPVFQKLEKKREIARSPLLAVIAEHPMALIAGTATIIGSTTLGYLVLVYMPSYGTSVLKLPRNLMLDFTLLAATIWFLTTIIFARFSDIFSVRRVYLTAAAVGILWAIPFFMLVDSTNITAMTVAYSVTAVVIAGMLGAQSALIASLFPPAMRFSGISIVANVGAILGGGIAPLIATSLYAYYNSSMAIAVYVGAMVVISFLGTLYRNKHQDEFFSSSASGRQ